MFKLLNREERNAIYDALLKKFSPNAQMIVAIEELSELQKEICKYLRNKEQLYHVKGLVEEIADVEIMIEQIKFLLSLDWQVEEMKDNKIRRTQERYLKEVQNVLNSFIISFFNNNGGDSFHTAS